jgi:ribosomal protein S18 acetylase RimI-like enzyme
VLTILPATADDILVLRDLAHRIWQAHYPGIISREQIDYMLARMYDVEVVRAELAAGVAWDLARHEGEPVGFSSCAFDEESRRVKLHKLYLLPALHGQGFGRQMLDHIKARALTIGAREIHLQVNKQNTRALRAYERAGFRVREAVVADIGGGFLMDDFILALELPA